MTVASLSAYASRRSPRPLAVARSVRTAASGSGGVLLLLGVALPVGVSVSRAPGLVLLASMTVALVAWIATHPAHGVYLVVVCTPLTAGIDRGSLIPVLRPSEAIAALVAAALFLRWIFGLKSARDVAIRHSPVATAIVILALTSSLLPAVWLLLRDQPFTTDDLFYTLTIWKLFVVYLIVRAAHLDEPQMWRCFYLSVGTAVVVGVIGALQARHVGPVIDLLSKYYTTNANVAALENSRGSSTLALPIAVADLMSFNLAVVVGISFARRRLSPALGLCGLVLLIGVVSAAQFSGVIGLAVGIIAICVVTASGRILRYIVPAGLFATILLWPVIENRLAGFHTTYGLPVSWTGRLINLQTYFWPPLFSHNHYLLGVRPAARIVAPHRANGFIWIESGYTWLLWAGGIPLLLAFGYFVVIAARTGMRAFRSGFPAQRVAGLAVVTAVAITTVLMIFDPHLTYRGSADALFVLLALSTPATQLVRPGDLHG